MDAFTLAQILGFLGAISMILSTWQKTRKKIFVFLIFDNIFYFLQYIVLGAYTGAYTNVIGLIRTMTFGKKNSNKILSTNYPLYVVIVLYILIGILTYDGLECIFPIIASVVYAVVLWQDQPSKIRKGTAFMLVLWFIYNIIVKAYVGAIVEGILFISAVAAIIKLDILKNKGVDKNETN